MGLFLMTQDASRLSTVLATALVTGVVAGAVGFSLGRMSAAGTPTPGTTSAEAGFARDMQVHHIQGVEMAMIIRERTEDTDVRRMAYDMATTQSHQAGQLYGWLVEWGLNQLGPEPPMMWMMRGASDGSEAGGPASEAPAMARNALMPGMATSEEMAELADASGVEAERIFLELMIRHHQGALEMSEAVLERSEHASVRTFAEAVLASQQVEIDTMNEMLAQRQRP